MPDVDLTLNDRTWCMIAGDDSRESIADDFETRYNQSASGEWTDLRKVLIETFPMVQNSRQPSDATKHSKTRFGSD